MCNGALFPKMDGRSGPSAKGRHHPGVRPPVPFLRRSSKSEAPTAVAKLPTLRELSEETTVKPLAAWPMGEAPSQTTAD